MTANYLDEALRACRLPISVSVDPDGWFCVRDRVTGMGYHVDNLKDAIGDYTDLRECLLAEQKENE